MEQQVDHLKQTEILVHTRAANDKLSTQQHILCKLSLRELGEDTNISLIQEHEKLKVANTIIFNAKLGLQYKKDYWLIKYGDRFLEVKNHKTMQYLAMKFSVKPIESINALAIYKKDEWSITYNNDNLLFDYSLKALSTADREKDNLEVVLFIVKYKDGTSLIKPLTSDYLAKCEDASQMKGTNGPWKKWYDQMIETKAIKAGIERYIILDLLKMVEAGVPAEYIKQNTETDFGDGGDATSKGVYANEIQTQQQIEPINETIEPKQIINQEKPDWDGKWHA